MNVEMVMIGPGPQRVGDGAVSQRFSEAPPAPPLRTPFDLPTDSSLCIHVVVDEENLLRCGEKVGKVKGKAHGFLCHTHYLLQQGKH